MKKLVYLFGPKRTDGSGKMKALLGGKGANLAEMAKLGLPVPPGFTVATSVCVYYLKKQHLPAGLKSEIARSLKFIEESTGKKFGSADNPLLLSVRSGARASMPGMMDTVLNLGLNDVIVEGLARKTNNRRFALDAYRRLIQMFGDVVLKTGREDFENELAAARNRLGVKTDIELDELSLEVLVQRFKEIVRAKTGQEFPQNPEEQLWQAIVAVLKSWNNPRACEYRRLYNIPDDWGTAVNVQAMVFGNLSAGSATGVMFTRDPATGEKSLYCEYLPNAQGEDIVAGIRTPLSARILKQELPEIYERLEKIARKLERHYRDMMDVEWTVEEGKLHILQCRVGKRSPQAGVKIAVDMTQERLISRSEAVRRIDPEKLGALLHYRIAQDAIYEVAAKGIPASPGAACGEIVLSPVKAVALSQVGRKVILVRHQTSADDVAGMAKAEGILTAAGGTTSHAAVVARGMGKPAVVGCSDLKVDYETGKVELGARELKEGIEITIDGTTGNVIVGKVKMEPPQITAEFATLLKWADSFRQLKVRTNADTPADAKKAREFGAEGIGLCRTEHMFFAPDRVGVMQEMILAEDEAGRKRALEKLLPMQRADFVEIFEVMDGLPVTIRTLDPPLHEFLPRDEEKIQQLAERLGLSVEKVKGTITRLEESNPMLGFRGCRLGIVYPEITAMQARAIFEAAVQVKNKGIKVLPEIMIPLVSDVEELRRQRQLIEGVAEQVFAQTKTRIEYTVGTMIEVPRAALLADEVARVAEFFSFGTNDLTQLTYAYSRDDYGKFFNAYQQLGIARDNPFDTLDIKGVGLLMKWCVKNGRKVNKKLKLGICGEHGGDPKTIVFCDEIGLDYVSCSPFRVPIARLVAAQARIGIHSGKDV
uniref:Pyruvate, phosphate dikinase n=1 Tax=candidate division WOR-3 bacterium TaxID=2052148 RepID=A0A7V3PSG3_UNCW3